MKILYVLTIGIVCFILNLIIYYISDDYRHFLKDIKGGEENNIILKDEYKINDNTDNKNVSLIKEKIKKIEKEKIYTKTADEIAEEKLKEKVAFIREKEKIEKEYEKKQEKVARVIKKIEKKEEDINESLKKIKVIDSNKGGEIKLNAYEKKFLLLFKKYNLVNLISHGDLLDVTSEYPDKYFEYYSVDLTLLIFPTKSYKEIKDIFNVESNGYNFLINEVDNFGEESFYVNLGEGYEDGFVRVIFTKKNRTFGFKVKKSGYLKVKNILKKL